MARVAVWHGTADEGEALFEAMRRNCSCQFGLMGARISTCPLHIAILDDQRWLDGLVYARRRLAKDRPGAANRVIPLEGA